MARHKFGEYKKACGPQCVDETCLYILKMISCNICSILYIFYKQHYMFISRLCGKMKLPIHYKD